MAKKKKTTKSTRPGIQISQAGVIVTMIPLVQLQRFVEHHRAAAEAEIAEAVQALECGDGDDSTWYEEQRGHGSGMLDVLEELEKEFLS